MDTKSLFSQAKEEVKATIATIQREISDELGDDAEKKALRARKRLEKRIWWDR